MYAGMNVIVSRNASVIPMATNTPNTRTGGIGANYRWEGFEKDRAEAIYEKRFGEKPREAQEEKG